MVTRMIESPPRNIEAAGESALMAAMSFWADNIVDPVRKAWGNADFADSRNFINDCILGPDGLGWTRCSPLVKEYRWDGDFEWCGAFAAMAWGRILRADIRKRYFASTYRLHKYAQHRRAFLEKMPPLPEPQARRKYLRLDGTNPAQVTAFAPRAGDIIVVNGKPFTDGEHIAVVRFWDPGARAFETVEGNATGNGPLGGAMHQGVVTQTRELPRCRFIVRPGTCDFMEVPNG